MISPSAAAVSFSRADNRNNQTIKTTVTTDERTVKQPTLPTTSIAEKTEGGTIIMRECHIQPGRQRDRAVQGQRLRGEILGPQIQYHDQHG